MKQELVIASFLILVTVCILGSYFGVPEARSSIFLVVGATICELSHINRGGNKPD